MEIPTDLLKPTIPAKPVDTEHVGSELAGLDNVMKILNTKDQAKTTSPGEVQQLAHTIQQTGSAIPDGAQAPTPKPPRSLDGKVHGAPVAMRPASLPVTQPTGIAAPNVTLLVTQSKRFFFTGQTGAGKSYVAELARAKGALVVARCETVEDFQTLKAAGFEHWHCCCTSAAIAQRKRRQHSDGALAAALDKQVSEQIRQPGDKLKAIFNDTAGCPERLWTVQQWLEAQFAPPVPEPEDLGGITL